MNESLTVTACRTFVVDLPLWRPHVMSFGSPDEVNYVLVKIETQDDLVGWGEAATFQGPTWSEESAETIKAIVDNYIAPRLIGHSLLPYDTVLSEIFGQIQANNFAKAAVEFAVLDIIGKFYDQPLYNLFGGGFRDRIQLSWSLASGSLEGDIAEARQKMAEGYRIFKLKAGASSWQEDVKRLERVRTELGSEVSLRVDVNQGWDFSTAVQAIERMQDYGLDFVEQPLPKWNLDGLAALRQKFSIPIMADESLTGSHAAMEMVKRKAADVFSFKMTKLGGLINARHVYFLAHTAGVAAYIGCMIETSLGTAAYLQFGASIPYLAYCCELWGPEMLKDDIAVNPIKFENGQVLIPTQPGLGVTVDEEKVKHYLRKV